MAVAAPPGAPVWIRCAGRRVAVLAPEGSYALTQAAHTVQAAERAVAALERIVRGGARATLEVLLVDAAPEGADGVAASDGVAPAPGGDAGGPPVLRIVSPEGGGEPLAATVTRALAARWFGRDAARADTLLRGLAGLVAARTGEGPTRAECDERAGALLAAGALPSLLGPVGERALVIEGAAAPRTVALGDAGLVVGRDPGAGLHLDDPGVSRRHAVFAVAAGTVLVADAGSRNGIRVNGTPVVRAQLADGDRVAVGDVELVLRDGGVPQAEPAAFTSFAAFLLDEFGPRALAAYLEAFDPLRRDRAPEAAFDAPLGTLEEAWQHALRRRADGAGRVKAFLRGVLPLLRPHRHRLVELTALMLLATANTVALPLGFRYLIDHVLPSGKVGDLLVFTAVLGGALLVTNLITLRRAYLSSRLSEQIGFELQERMFVHMQGMSHAFFSRVRGGDLLARFTRDLALVQAALVSIASGGVALVISAIAAFVALAFLNLLVAGLVLTVLPLYALAHLVLHSRLKRLSYERQQQAGDAVAVLQESLLAHDLIKAYGGEGRALAGYRARLERSLQTAYRLVMTGAGLQASVGMMASLAQLEVLGVGGWLVLRGDLSLGTLLAAISLAPSVLQPITQLSATAQSAQAAAGSLARIQELLDQEPEIADAPGAQALGALRDGIEFDGVTLAYGPGRPALDAVSLRIPAGSRVAFVGPSGAGKTSLLNVLLRFWDPTAGRVLVDGVDASGCTVASLRSHFGVILQDTFLFNTTVRANIAFGRPGAGDDEIEAAARAAQLDEFVRGLPAGYETVLGDRGVRLSGGQRQRMAIARALLRDPAVLVLDEATSALDAHTEAELRRSLDAAGAGRTVIAITHRLSSAADADTIFVLADGRLAESGTHDELVAAGGLYRQLWEEQNGAVDDAAVTPGRTVADLHAALAAVPLLAGAPPEALAALGAAATLERHPAGGEVAGPADPARLLVVLDGELELQRGGGVAATALGRGDFVGELGLVRDQPLPGPLRARTPARVVALDRIDFLAVATREPALQGAVLAQLTGRRRALAAAVSASGSFAPLA